MATQLDQLKVIMNNAEGTPVEYIVGQDPATVVTQADLATKTDTTVTAAVIDRVAALENEPDVDLTPYATTTAMNTAISTAVSTAENALDARLDTIEADYVTTAEMTTAINNIELAKLKGRVDSVDDLPTENNVNGDIWAVGLSTDDVLAEYIYIEDLGEFELFGSFSSSDVDLSDYATTEAMNTALALKADATALATLQGEVDALELTVETLDGASVKSATVNGTEVTVTDGNLDILIGTTTFTVEEDVDAGTSIGVITFK